MAPPQRAGTEFPIYSYLLALLYGAFGVHETLGRILSAAFAAWGAIYLFLFLRRRLDTPLALGSALAMCVIPVHIYFTRTVQPESMALWGFLAFLFYGERFLQQQKLRDGVLAILCGALPCLLKLSFAYLILGMWAALIWDHKGRRGLGFRGGYAVILAIFGLTWMWYAYAKTAPIQVLPLDSASNWKNLQPFFTWHLWWTHLISRLPEIYATYPGLLLSLIGAWALRREHRLRFFALWFVITFFYQGLLGAYGLEHKYTALPFAPIMGTWIAIGAQRLWHNRYRWHVPAWAVVVLILGIPLHAALRIGHWYTLERLWVFDARKKLAAISNPNDLVLTNTAEHPVLLYYLDRYGYAAAFENLKPIEWDLQWRKGARFFVTSREPRWENHPELRAYFDRHGACVVETPDYLIYRLKPTA